MTDFLSGLIADTAPIERELTFRGNTGPVYFRRISAGERAQLTKGQKVLTGGDGPVRIEIDVGDNQTSQHMLVQFSVCNPDGTKRFKNLREVQIIDGALVSALYALASDVNREEEAGKA